MKWIKKQLFMLYIKLFVKRYVSGYRVTQDEINKFVYCVNYLVKEQ